MSEWILAEYKHGYVIRLQGEIYPIEVYAFSTLAEVQEYLPTLFPQPPISEDI